MFLAPSMVESAPAPEINRVSENLHMELRGGAWFPRLHGNVTPGSGATEFNFETDLQLDSSEATPLFELHFRWQDWSAVLSAFSFDTSADATLGVPVALGSVVPAGTLIHSAIGIDSGALEIKYDFYRPFADRVLPWRDREANVGNVNTAGDYIADLRLGPTAGVRYLDVDQSYEPVGFARVENSATSIAAMGGVDLTLDLRPGTIPLVERLEVQGGIAGGWAFGDAEGFLWQVRAGLTLFLTPNFGVSAGYRLLELDTEADDFDFQGSMQGFYLGGSVGF